MTEEPDHTDPAKPAILRVYALYGMALALSVIPHMIAAGLCMVLFFLVLVMAYILRSGAEENSLMYNHMTFTIRTIWIGGLLAAVTIVAASLYLFQMLDNTPLDPCIQKFITMGPADVFMGPEMLQQAFGTCYDAYVVRNMTTFIISGAIAAVPILLYFGVRYLRGLSRARGGYRVAKPLAWL